MEKRWINTAKILMKNQKNIKKNQSELKNTTIEIRNTLEKINGRSGDIGKCVHDLEDIIMGIAQSEPQKCIFKKMRLVQGVLRLHHAY